jgi:hypothetical protein
VSGLFLQQALKGTHPLCEQSSVDNWVGVKKYGKMHCCDLHTHNVLQSQREVEGYFPSVVYGVA